MNNKLPFLLFLIVLFSCRKDDSVISETGSNQKSCIIKETRDLNGNLVTKWIYDKDSVIVEEYHYIDGEIEESQFRIQEKKGQYRFYVDGTEPENLVSRIYLNEDGTVHKEAAFIVNDNGNFEENPEDIDIYIYNSKKQLIKLERENKQGEKVYIDFQYDSKDRVRHISLKDKDDKEVTYYNGFSYEDRVKKDNYTNLYFSEATKYFVPSLSNVYIKSYNVVTPKIGMNGEDLVVKCLYEFSFSEGKLATVISSGVLFGIPFTITEKVSLSCK